MWSKFYTWAQQPRARRSFGFKQNSPWLTREKATYPSCVSLGVKMSRSSLAESFCRLGEDESDLKRWINESLAEVPSGVTLLQHLGNVRSEVQQMAATWSNSMEELGGACLPRVMRSLKEIELLRSESESLCELVTQLSENVNNLDMESIKSLSELEVIKRRMDSCRSVFAQADRFKILLGNMDAIYESGDVPRMSSALADLVQSFTHLSSLSEFEGDKALVSRYTERLESLVKPKLLLAFEQHNTAQASACIQTFAQINLSDQITLIHHKYFNQRVLQIWQTFDTAPTSTTAISSATNQVSSERSGAQLTGEKRDANNEKVSSTSGKSGSPSDAPSFVSNLPTWIEQFYHALTPVIVREVTWIPSLFSEASTTIATLLISCMNQLSTLLDRHLKSLSIEKLLSTYQITKTFASSIDHLIQPLGIGLRFQVFQSVFAPYRKYQTQFQNLETKWISTQTPPEATGKSDPSSLIANIVNHANAVFLTLHTSIDHCMTFTEGMETETLQKLITKHLLTLLSYASQKIQALNPMLTAPHAANVTNGTHPTNQRSSPSIPSLPSNITDANEWREDLFNLALDALKAAVGLENSFNKLVSTFRTKVLAQRATLFGEQDLKQIYQQVVPVVPNLFLYQSQEAVHKLAQLFDALESSEYEPFPACPKMIDAFISTVQFMLFETMFGFIRHQMSNFSKLANFGKESSHHDSPAPQSYVKQIVEHFLILPQAMEAVEHQSEEQPPEEKSFLSVPVKPFDILGRPKYFGLPPSVLAEENEAIEQAGGFSVDWMILMARETQLLLASHILQLPQLSSLGVIQLESDITHLFSVLSVLELRQEPILEQILNYCKVPASEFATLLGQTIDAEHKKILILIGRSRKILPTGAAK